MSLATAHTGWEWGRNFYQDGDGVTIGRPLTSRSGGTIRWGLREDDAALHPGSAWTGIYHSHPADLDGLDREASHRDIRLAMRYGKTSYVLPASGDLLKIDPVTGKVTDLRTGRVVQ